MAVSNIYAVILAGGSGSRLWPLSRELHPKQLMKIEDDYTLFQSAFIRLVNCVDDKNILSITNVKLESQVKAQLKEMQEKFCRKSSYRVITEPEGKNTAPAIALAIKYIEKLQQDKAVNQENIEDAIIVAVPSDNLITDNEKYCKSVSEGIKLAKEGYIVCFQRNECKLFGVCGIRQILLEQRNVCVQSFCHDGRAQKIRKRYLQYY